MDREVDDAVSALNARLYDIEVKVEALLHVVRVALMRSGKNVDLMERLGIGEDGQGS